MPSAHKFTIPVSSLDAAGREFRFPVPASWVKGVLEGSEATAAGNDGELDVRVSKSGNDVVVHGTLKADLVLPCARCMEPVPLHIDQTVSALMVPAAQVKSRDFSQPDEYEFKSDEAETLPYDGETVVLDDLVRDELVLDIPMIPLCREDCPGMTRPPNLSGPEPVEKEKPIDPRLAPLLRLKQQPNKE